MLKISRINRYSSRLVGLVQATSVAAYVLFFALIASNLTNWLPNPPVVFAIMSFLIAFIISALVCASLVFGYPVILALRGQISRAVEVVVWSGVSLLLILMLVMASLLLGPREGYG